MEIFRYSSDAWGQTALEGISWDLLPFFFGMGVVVIVAHALIKWVNARNQG
ncbi:MAG: hypothetical protein VYE04_00790 [Pseudomonadota bacterium]|nr:hypothetical protein [Pseudomonadota bacterium]